MNNIDVKEFVTSERKLESSNLSNQLNVRLSDIELKVIDEHIEKIEKQYPGLRVSRSEMGRILMLRGASNG